MRGISGAVLNHLLLMKTRGMFFCIILAIAAMIVHAVTDDDIARNVSILVFLLLIPLTTLNSSNISFDSKWNRIEKLWDVSPFVMIAARYIVYAAISITLSAIWVLTPFHDGNMQNIADFVMIVLFTGALFYPIMYILNSDHNIGILIIFFSAAGGFMLLSWLATRIDHNWADGINLLLLGAVCGIYVISLALSIIFNRFHASRSV